MKRIILLGLLYFGLFGFNSVKSITLDDVVKVGGGLCAAVTVVELVNAFRCSNRYLSITDSVESEPNLSITDSVKSEPNTYSYNAFSIPDRQLQAERRNDQYKSAMDHFKTALFTACLTGLALKKLKII